MSRKNATLPTQYVLPFTPAELRDDATIVRPNASHRGRNAIQRPTSRQDDGNGRPLASPRRKRLSDLRLNDGETCFLCPFADEPDAAAYAAAADARAADAADAT